MVYETIKCPKCKGENFTLTRSVADKGLIVTCANCLAIAQESVRYETNKSRYFNKFFSRENQE